jgi:hypothetical protein
MVEPFSAGMVLGHDTDPFQLRVAFGPGGDVGCVRPASRACVLGIGGARWRLRAGTAEVALPDTPLQPLPPAEDASEIFADAPYGVDPIVTGPVSAEFRDRQRALGCKAATWPHISSGCYPD